VCSHCRFPVFITGISLYFPVLPCKGLQCIFHYIVLSLMSAQKVLWRVIGVCCLHLLCCVSSILSLLGTLGLMYWCGLFTIKWTFIRWCRDKSFTSLKAHTAIWSGFNILVKLDWQLSLLWGWTVIFSSYEFPILTLRFSVHCNCKVC
jgi:hypothetical protein